MNFSAVFNHWLHLISAAVWIGGLGYQVFVLNPLIKPGTLPPDTLLEMTKRFRRISLVALIILITTGGINLGVRRAGSEIPPEYISALGVKVFLIVGLAVSVVFGIVRSTTSDDDDESQSEEVQSALPSITGTKMTFAIGVIVIFIASMLRQWKF